jgi:hypothetical protein
MAAQTSRMGQQAEQAKDQQVIGQGDDQTLGRVAQFLQANPGENINPQIMRTVGEVYQRRGLPVPTLPTGGLDVNALSPKIQLQQLLSQLPSADILQLESDTPEQRRVKLTARGVDVSSPDAQAYINMSPVKPYSATDAVGFDKAWTSMLESVGKPGGAGLAGVQQFLDTHAEDFQRYLGQSPQDIMLSPAFIAAANASFADQEQKLVELGILHPKAMDKYHEDSLTALNKRAAMTLRERQVYDADLAQHWAREDATAQARVEVAKKNTDIAKSRVDALTNEVGSLTTLRQAQAFEVALKPLQQQHAAAEAELTNATRVIEKAMADNNGTLPDDPSIQALVKHATELKTTADTLGVSLNKLQSSSAASVILGRVANAVVGKPVSPQIPEPKNLFSGSQVDSIVKQHGLNYEWTAKNGARYRTVRVHGQDFAEQI